MRKIDSPFFVTAKDGHVHFECAGATAMLDPALALLAGTRLVARVKAARHGKLAGAPQRGLEAGEKLIAFAAEASRHDAARLPAAA